MTSPATTEPGRAVARRRIVIANLPDLVAPALALASIAVLGVLLIEQFHPWLALPAALGAAAVAVVLLRPATASRGVRNDPFLGRLRPVGVLALLVIAAAAVNIWLHSEYLFAWRDPATYGILGRWLVDHPSPLLPYDAAMFAGDVASSPGSLGFGVTAPGDAVYAQGNHLLPALLAVGGWLLGPDAVLVVNPVLGALSLIPLYAAARRMVGEWWALVPAMALAASMPYLAFTRATYTEPLTLLFLFGGLALAARALANGRVVDALLAGITFGSATMVRVDAYVALLALPVAAATWCVVADPATRRTRLAQAGALALGAVLPLPLAVIDLRVYSPGYWEQRLVETRPLLIAGLALLLVGSIVVWLGTRTRLGEFVRTHGVGIGTVVGSLVVAGFVVLASRPLWLVSRRATPDMEANIAAMQQGLGLPIDPTRSYDELSVTWLAWYLGWPAIALGVAGLYLMCRVMLTRGREHLVFPVATICALAALYLTRVLIYPDQIWAVRRLFPVVLPGLAVAAAYAAAAVTAAVARRGRADRRSWLPWVAAAVLVATLLVLPSVRSRPLGLVVDYDGERAHVEAVCDAVPSDAAVVLVGNGGARAGYLQTVRVFCDVPTTGVSAPVDAAALGTIAQAISSAGRTPFVLVDDPTAVSWSTPPSPLVEGPEQADMIVKWAETLTAPPASSVHFQRPLFVGRLGADGEAEPVS